MIKVAADTSALISLEIVGLLVFSSRHFRFFITEEIVKELNSMAQFKDQQGKAAIRVLDLIKEGRIKVVKVKNYEKHLAFIDGGEAEILELAIKNNLDYLISDDYEAFLVFK